MRITKAQAEEAAQKMLAEKRSEVKKRKEQFKNKLEEYYVSKIPTVVLETFKLHPNYFQSTCYFTPTINGEYHPIHTFSSDYPFVSTKIDLSGLDCKSLREELLSIEKAERHNNRLEEQTMNTLCDLRTMANVEKHFPEAIPFISVKQTTAIAINTSSIRKELFGK